MDFQTGVNNLYNQLVSKGVTPSTKTLVAITNSINTLYTNAYNTGVANGKAKNFYRIATYVSEGTPSTIPSGCLALIVYRPRSTDSILINGSSVLTNAIILTGAYDVSDNWDNRLVVILNPSSGTLNVRSGGVRNYDAWVITR